MSSMDIISTSSVGLIEVARPRNVFLVYTSICKADLNRHFSVSMKEILSAKYEHIFFGIIYKNVAILPFFNDFGESFICDKS